MDQERDQQQQRSSPLDTYLNARSGLRNLRFLIKGARAVGPLLSVLTNPVSLGIIAVVIFTFLIVFSFTPGGPGNIELPPQDSNGNIPSVKEELALSCPIPGGKIVSSSFFDADYPYRHCGPGFVSTSACQYKATYYGIDIGYSRTSTNDNQNTVSIPFLIPKESPAVGPVSCTLNSAIGPSCPASGCENQWILQYKCSSPNSKKDVYMQFHHIKPLGNGEPSNSFKQLVKSGDVIGEVARYDTNLRLLNLQIGIGGPCSGGEQNCVRGEQYAQCPKL